MHPLNLCCISTQWNTGTWLYGQVHTCSYMYILVYFKSCSTSTYQYILVHKYRPVHTDKYRLKCLRRTVEELRTGVIVHHDYSSVSLLRIQMMTVVGRVPLIPLFLHFGCVAARNPASPPPPSHLRAPTSGRGQRARRQLEPHSSQAMRGHYGLPAALQRSQGVTAWPSRS